MSAPVTYPRPESAAHTVGAGRAGGVRRRAGRAARLPRVRPPLGARRPSTSRRPSPVSRPERRRPRRTVANPRRRAGLADAILTHRRDRGRFTAVDDLNAVHGIGDRTLEKLRPWVTVPAPRRAGTDRAARSSGWNASRPPRLSAPVKSGKLRPGDPPIDVNAASEEELQRLPGVGPVMARKIVEARGVERVQSSRRPAAGERDRAEDDGEPSPARRLPLIAGGGLTGDLRPGRGLFCFRSRSAISSANSSRTFFLAKKSTTHGANRFTSTSSLPLSVSVTSLLAGGRPRRSVASATSSLVIPRMWSSRHLRLLLQHVLREVRLRQARG